MARLFYVLGLAAMINAFALPVLAVPCAAAKTMSITAEPCACCDAAAATCNHTCTVVAPAPMIAPRGLVLAVAPTMISALDKTPEVQGLTLAPADPPSARLSTPLLFVTLFILISIKLWSER